jgi:hypothetical protein
MAGDERGRRAPTPAALASLREVPGGFRILPDPLYGQPLTRLPPDLGVELRILLDRSSESARVNEPTQDYLAVRGDPRRLTFAVTDGVGSSFLGDVAAQILAAHLTDWLARASEPFDATLEVYLRGLSREVADRVASWPLPGSVSGLVRSALDQQRAYGSEAMFACGAVDLTGGRDASVTVAWLGDTRVRVIMRDGRHISHSGQTTDRWSSRLGPRGRVRSHTWPLAEVARVIVCTDGLVPEFDAAVDLADDALADRLQALARRPGNDDMSLIDVGVTPRALPGGDVAGGSTLWRRLTEEPPGRHARPTTAGSALRRLMRAVGPAQTPPTPPTPPAAPSSSPTSPAPAVPTQAPASAPVRGSAQVPVARNPAAREPEPASTVEALGPPPPSAVRWQGREVSWTPVSGADSYEVQVGREPTFADPLLYAVPGLSLTVPPIPGPTYVRVRGVAAGGPGPWGAGHDLSGWTTTTPAPPAAGAP